MLFGFLGYGNRSVRGKLIRIPGVGDLHALNGCNIALPYDRFYGALPRPKKTVSIRSPGRTLNAGQTTAIQLTEPGFSIVEPRPFLADESQLGSDFGRR